MITGGRYSRHSYSLTSRAPSFRLWSQPSTSFAPPSFSGSTPSEASSCCWVNGWFPWILDYGQARRLPLGSSRGTRKIPKRHVPQEQQPVCRCLVEILYLREKGEDTKSRDGRIHNLSLPSSRFRDPAERREGKWFHWRWELSCRVSTTRGGLSWLIM